MCSRAEGLVCTHQEQGEVIRDDDTRSVTESERAHARRETLSRRGRGQQPKAGVIRGYMVALNYCFDKFSEAFAMLCSQLTDRNDKDDLHVQLVEHVEYLKTRAREVLDLLETVQNRVSTEVTTTVDQINEGASGSQVLQQQLQNKMRL